MNIAVVTRLPDGQITALVSDRHDRYMLEMMQDLAARPDASKPVWVEVPTGGNFVVDGDSILEAFEVPDGTNARDVKADYLERVGS